ncbi:MAG: hypothetical protein ACI4UT_01430 [Candidatus Enteromonas sp.]
MKTNYPITTLQKTAVDNVLLLVKIKEKRGLNMLFSLLMTVASCLPSVFASTKIDVEEEVLPYASLHDSLANSANILDGAQVTVFTHGMGGTYKDWLSKDSETGFVANDDYLPFSLSRDNVFILDKRNEKDEVGPTSLYPVEFDSSDNYLVHGIPAGGAAASASSTASTSSRRGET